MTAVLAVFTYRLWSDGREAGRRQSKATEDALALNREMYSADHRPWVTLSIGLNSGLRFDTNRKTWSVQLKGTLTNIGKSPAIRAHFRATLFPRFMAAHLSEDVRKQFHPDTLGVEIDGGAEQQKMMEDATSFLDDGRGWGSVLFPGESIDVFHQLDIGGPAFTLAMTSRSFTGQFDVFVCVAYRSTFSDAPLITAKSYVLYKVGPTGAAHINGAGEVVPQTELVIQPHVMNNTSHVQ